MALCHQGSALRSGPVGAGSGRTKRDNVGPRVAGRACGDARLARDRAAQASEKTQTRGSEIPIIWQDDRMVVGMAVAVAGVNATGGLDRRHVHGPAAVPMQTEDAPMHAAAP